MTERDSSTESNNQELNEGEGGSTGNTEDVDSFNKVTPIRERTSPASAWLIVGAAFFVGGLVVMAMVSVAPGFWFVVGGSIAALPFWALLTESGENWLENVESYQNKDNSTQSINVSNSSENNLICSACGWKNPQSNNHCHDCGRTLSSE